jgi:hypothetical protein
MIKYRLTFFSCKNIINLKEKKVSFDEKPYMYVQLLETNFHRPTKNGGGLTLVIIDILLDKQKIIFENPVIKETTSNWTCPNSFSNTHLKSEINPDVNFKDQYINLTERHRDSFNTNFLRTSFFDKNKSES